MVPQGVIDLDGIHVDRESVPLLQFRESAEVVYVRVGQQRTADVLRTTADPVDRFDDLPGLSGVAAVDEGELAALFQQHPVHDVGVDEIRCRRVTIEARDLQRPGGADRETHRSLPDDEDERAHLGDLEPGVVEDRGIEGDGVALDVRVVRVDVLGEAEGVPVGAVPEQEDIGCLPR